MAKSPFTKPSEDMLRAAQDMKIPPGFQAFATQSLDQTRVAYDKMAVMAKDAGKALEDVSVQAHQGMRELGDKVLATASENAEAAFDAAQAIARCRSLPEMARIQSEFMQTQLAKAGEQTREFLELSTRVARDTFEMANAAGSRTFERMRTGG